MHSYQFIDKVSFLENTFNKNADFIMMLGEIAKLSDKLLGVSLDIINAKDQSTINSCNSDLRSKFPWNLNELISIQPRFLYASIDELEAAIGLMEENLQVGSLIEELHDLSNSFDSYFSNKNKENALTLIFNAQSFYKSIAISQSSNQFILSHLTPERQEDTSKVFSLFFPGSVELEAFGEKISSLYQIFNDSAYLFKLSASDLDLTIVKIESGSWYTELLANPAVVSFVTAIVTAASTFVYHNYTTEGQIISISEKVDTIDSVLKLREKLQSSGINVDGMDEELEKVSVRIARALDTLVADQYSLEVNGEPYSLDSSSQKLLLKDLEQKKLNMAEE